MIAVEDSEAWKLFEATGSPHAFLIYNRQKEANNRNRGDFGGMRSQTKGKGIKTPPLV